MKKILFIFFLLGAIFQIKAQSNLRYFSFERTGCFGKCPIYKVEVLMNGKITYVGKLNVDRLGTFEGKLTRHQILQITHAIAKSKLPKKSIKYKKIASDLPSLNYWYEIGKKRITVFNVNQGPIELNTIALVIDSIVTKLKWRPALPREVEPPGERIQMGEDNKPSFAEEQIFSFVEQMPEFPGGEKAMMEFVSTHLKYPTAAIENGIEGKVIVGFTVDNAGSIYAVNIAKGLEESCNNEAMRIVKAMPKWKPGTQNGKPVAVKYNLPISFKLTK
jgi:TonB family protein